MKVKVRQQKNWTCTIQLEIILSILVNYFKMLAFQQNANTQYVKGTHTFLRSDRDCMQREQNSGKQIYLKGIQFNAQIIPWVLLTPLALNYCKTRITTFCVWRGGGLQWIIRSYNIVRLRGSSGVHLRIKCWLGLWVYSRRHLVTLSGFVESTYHSFGDFTVHTTYHRVRLSEVNTPYT